MRKTTEDYVIVNGVKYVRAVETSTPRVTAKVKKTNKYDAYRSVEEINNAIEAVTGHRMSHDGITSSIRRIKSEKNIRGEKTMNRPGSNRAVPCFSPSVVREVLNRNRAVTNVAAVMRKLTD